MKGEIKQDPEQEHYVGKSEMFLYVCKTLLDNPFIEAVNFNKLEHGSEVFVFQPIINKKRSYTYMFLAFLSLGILHCIAHALGFSPTKTKRPIQKIEPDFKDFFDIKVATGKDDADSYRYTHDVPKCYDFYVHGFRLRDSSLIDTEISSYEDIYEEFHSIRGEELKGIIDENQETSSERSEKIKEMLADVDPYSPRPHLIT